MGFKMASTDREYSLLYIYFLAMAVDRPSIIFVSCTMTSIECNDSEIILKINFQIKIKTYENVLFKTVLNDKNFIKLKLIRILKKDGCYCILHKIVL